MNQALCIIGALKSEVAGIKKMMEIHATHSVGIGTVFYGILYHKRIVLIRSGVGRHLARNALEKVCDHYTVSGILSIGFAGGLVSKLSLGDLVIADTIRGIETNKAFEKIDLLTVDRLLVERALKLSFEEALPRWRGGLVTIDQPACKPSEKRKLGWDFNAIAVDMESSALLHEALKMEIPFLSVRAISDSVDQELIDFSNYIGISGEISKAKAGWHILTHPGLLPQIEILRKGARTAAKNLTRFLQEWVRYLS